MKTMAEEWESGTEVAYSNWMEGEPDSSLLENGSYLSGEDGLKWTAEYLKVIKGYVCEKEAVAN